VESQDWRDGSLDQAIRYAVALGVGLKEMHQAVSDAAVQIAVAAENGNLQRAARRLGVTPRALQLRRASQRNCGHPQGLGQGDK
jgi:DNA-binding NtrC family response regulator